MAEEVQRRIYYYDLSLLMKKEIINKNGEISKKRKNEKVKNQSQCLRDIFAEIKKKQDNIASEKDENQRKELQKDFELETEKRDKIYVFVDELEDNKPIRFRLIICRSNAFPFVYRDGKLEPLTTEIEGEFALAEITHCIIFPDKMVMGAEFNFHGARPSGIATYITYKSSDAYFMSCLGKMNNDAIEKIAEGISLSLFDIGIKNDERMNLLIEQNAYGLGALFRVMPSEIGEYELVLKKRKTKKQRGFDSPFTKEQYKDFIKENREYIHKLRVSQNTYNDAIDLLNDKLVHTVPLDIETKDKSIVSNYMYEEIEKYFNSTVIHYCD